MSGRDDERPSAAPDARTPDDAGAWPAVPLAGADTALGHESDTGASHVGTGYVYCACRDCFDTAIGILGEAFCGLCEDAGCPDNQGLPSTSQECCRDDAYEG